MADVRAAQEVVKAHMTPAPLVRSHKLETELGLAAAGRRVYLKVSVPRPRPHSPHAIDTSPLPQFPFEVAVLRYSMRWGCLFTCVVRRRRRHWQDYGWTPSGSFKLMGALNWMSHQIAAGNLDGGRPVAAHSSGNFASGIAFAGHRYNFPTQPPTRKIPPPPNPAQLSR